MTDEVFARGMLRLSVLFLPEQRVGTDMMLVYRQALADLTDHQFMEAVRWAEQACKFMPKPADLREYLALDPVPLPSPPPSVTPVVMGMTLSDYLAFARGEGPPPDALQERAMLSDPKADALVREELEVTMQEVTDGSTTDDLPEMPVRVFAGRAARVPRRGRRHGHNKG